MLAKNKNQTKVAVMFVNNEIILESLKKAVEKLGYEVRQDMDSCLDARFAIIGAYFAYLGIIKQLRAINPLMPVVVIESSDYKLNGFLGESGNEVYDVIHIDNNDELEISRKIQDWFSKGQGKLLVGKD